MLHSYQDTQGGGDHRYPPQVVNCPNHPRLDMVNKIVTITMGLQLLLSARFPPCIVDNWYHRGFNHSFRHITMFKT